MSVDVQEAAADLHQLRLSTKRLWRDLEKALLPLRRAAAEEVVDNLKAYHAAGMAANDFGDSDTEPSLEVNADNVELFLIPEPDKLCLRVTLEWWNEGEVQVSSHILLHHKVGDTLEQTRAKWAERRTTSLETCLRRHQDGAAGIKKMLNVTEPLK